MGNIQDTINGIQERIDWLEFKSPVTLKSFIFGKDKYDKELERLKKVKRELKEMLSSKEKRVLCIGCGKPIKIDRLGGLNEKGLFHDNVFCLMKIEKKEASNGEALMEKEKDFK